MPSADGMEAVPARRGVRGSAPSSSSASPGRYRTRSARHGRGVHLRLRRQRPPRRPTRTCTGVDEMGEVAAEAVEPLGHEHVAPPQGAQAAIETKPVVAEGGRGSARMGWPRRPWHPGDHTSDHIPTLGHRDVARGQAIAGSGRRPAWRRHGAAERPCRCPVTASRGATSLSSLPVRAPRAALVRSLRGIRSPSARPSASKTWGPRQALSASTWRRMALRRRGRSLKVLVRHVQLSGATVPRLRQPVGGAVAVDRVVDAGPARSRPLRRIPAITAARRPRSRATASDPLPRPRHRGRWVGGEDGGEVRRLARPRPAPAAGAADPPVAGEDPGRPFPGRASGGRRRGPGSTRPPPSRRSPAPGPGSWSSVSVAQAPDR